MTLLVSWNVAGRVRSVPAQAEALAEQHADVLALQELRVSSLGAWRAALRAAGFEHVVSTLDDRDTRVRMTEHGYRDAFRTLHGYSRRDRSWLYPNGRMGYRLDHILVRGLAVAACEYRHDLRERRLSDHSAIWADLRDFLSSR